MKHLVICELMYLLASSYSSPENSYENIYDLSPLNFSYSIRSFQYDESNSRLHINLRLHWWFWYADSKNLTDISHVLVMRDSQYTRRSNVTLPNGRVEIIIDGKLNSSSISKNAHDFPFDSAMTHVPGFIIGSSKIQCPPLARTSPRLPCNDLKYGNTHEQSLKWKIYRIDFHWKNYSITKALTFRVTLHRQTYPLILRIILLIVCLGLLISVQFFIPLFEPMRSIICAHNMLIGHLATDSFYEIPLVGEHGGGVNLYRLLAVINALNLTSLIWLVFAQTASRSWLVNVALPLRLRYLVPERIKSSEFSVQWEYIFSLVDKLMFIAFVPFIGYACGQFTGRHA